MPDKTSLDEKVSDLVGNVSLSTDSKFKINYDFFFGSKLQRFKLQ